MDEFFLRSDPTVDFGFGMCLVGMIIIILSGIFVPQRKEYIFNKILIIGSSIAVIGGIIILSRIT